MSGFGRIDIFIEFEGEMYEEVRVLPLGRRMVEGRVTVNTEPE